ncbi:hypothetical protein BH20ACT5_BH20ACT5_03300 [soil metagenome]
MRTPSAAEFVAANEALMAERRARGSAAALDSFLSRLVGPDWRATMERHLPGATEQMHRDAVTFFDSDIPALLSWRFEDAHKISQPVLHIGGDRSGHWFAEVRELMLEWFPRAEDVVLAGADHSLALTHPGQVAAVLVNFLDRHPMAGSAVPR